MQIFYYSEKNFSFNEPFNDGLNTNLKHDDRSNVIYQEKDFFDINLFN